MTPALAGVPTVFIPVDLDYVALLPMLVTYFVPFSIFTVTITVTSLIFLAALGALAAKTGGAPVFMGGVRVTFWGALAMAITYGVGVLFGAVV